MSETLKQISDRNYGHVFAVQPKEVTTVDAYVIIEDANRAVWRLWFEWQDGHLLTLLERLEHVRCQDEERIGP